MKINKNNTPEIKLVYSSDIVKDAAVHSPPIQNKVSNRNQIVLLNALIKEGHRCDHPNCILNRENEDAWLSLLKTSNPPSFLDKYLRNEGQDILICHDIRVDMCIGEEAQENLQDIFFHKFWIKRFEKFYHYSYHHHTQAILFMIPDEQAQLFSPFEELFDYIAPHIDIHGEKSYWYLSTDQSAFDDFVEVSDAINLQLDQLLWREQKANLAVREYFKN
jgi:hypothetical protein